MRLSDIMSNMDLAVYPVIALVLFAGVFVLVTGRALRVGRDTHARWARIPLDGEPGQSVSGDQKEAHK